MVLLGSQIPGRKLGMKPRGVLICVKTSLENWEQNQWLVKNLQDVAPNIEKET